MLIVILLLIFFQDIGIEADVEGTSSSIQDTLVGTVSNNSIINITNTTVLSSMVVLKYLENILIVGDSIDCNSNGSVKFVSCKNVTIEGVRWEQCGTLTNPAIGFYDSSNVKIQNCSFHRSTGQAVVLSKVSGNVYINNCQFTHNNAYEGQGTTIHISQSKPHVQLHVVIDKCNFTVNGPAESVVCVDGIPNHNNLQLTTKNSVFMQNQGVPIYISHTNLHLNDSVLFEQNKASNGGGIYNNHSSVIFSDRSNVIFSRNSVQNNGGCIFLNDSNVLFTGNSTAEFTDNNASEDGGAVFSNSRSNIFFSDNSTVIFSNNLALGKGGAVSWRSSFVTFLGTAGAKFSGNIRSAVYTSQNSVISFDEGSNVTFSHNSGTEGGALYFKNTGGVLFNGSTSVTFINNSAEAGGAIYFKKKSYIVFGLSSKVNFSNNQAELNGGAIASVSSTSILFTGNSSTSVTHNTAGQDGAAIYSILESSIKFIDRSIVSLQNNTAMQHGGAIFSFRGSDVTFKANAVVTFNYNVAEERGGAVYSTRQSKIYFKGNSHTAFTNNKAHISGGAIASSYDGIVHFEKDSTLTFSNNSCTFFGGAFNIYYNSTADFTQLTNITFQNNTAIFGGAMRAYDNSIFTIKGSSTLTFVGNKAIYDGGSIFCGRTSDLTLKGNSLVTFTNNTARDGGAISILQSNITFAGNSSIQFMYNKAYERGGAIYLDDKFILSVNDSSNIRYLFNYADRYGGAVYGSVIQNNDSKMTVDNSTYTDFKNNTASVGNNVYINMLTSCDKICRDEIMVDSTDGTFNRRHFTNHVITPFSKLVLYDPAECVNHTSHTNNSDMNYCPNNKYQIKNVMLGQEIIIDACVLDHFDNNASATQFALKSNNSEYHIDGPSFILISCDMLQGIKIKGKKVCDLLNVSVLIVSHVNSLNQEKLVIELITELSPCHPGFHYNNTLHHCECYDKTSIVSCSDDHTSTIKIGYWFGTGPGNGEATVSVCPDNYCNFSCCETANGYYQLSPARMNQCSSHRSGTACGSCEEGYTLSFDSVQCVNVNKCTTEQTVMVVTLSMIYWIVIVIAVFIMSYYHVGIGYLYAITYYYSMLDILLSQNLYQSKGLFTAVSIVSSLAKITPQFLGQLCLVEDMIGIDQQFIHYVHPLAVSVIIVIICLSARISLKFSSFISRGIISTVCMLLLLSYTSVATTSLLLLRSLRFDSGDKVYIYTYLSPDIEYFHGHHLPYVIVAVLCTLVIVTGLPLLLLLEPFLNHKINFIRMKPLLDQFQGCYKDKYRCFAAYYMICRILIIVIIIIANPSDYVNAQFLLVAASMILALIQLIVRPYERNILNIFDGFVLHAMALVAMTPLINNYNQYFLLSITYILIMLPLIVFTLMELFINKHAIKKITKRLCHKPNLTANYPAHNDYCYVSVGDYVAPKNVIMLNM